MNGSYYFHLQKRGFQKAYLSGGLNTAGGKSGIRALNLSPVCVLISFSLLRSVEKGVESVVLIPQMCVVFPNRVSSYFAVLELVATVEVTSLALEMRNPTRQETACLAQGHTATLRQNPEQPASPPASRC